jgi:hypothetical protein
MIPLLVKIMIISNIFDIAAKPGIFFERKRQELEFDLSAGQKLLAPENLQAGRTGNN